MIRHAEDEAAAIIQAGEGEREAILEAAQQEAEQIKAQAQQEAEQIKTQAQQEAEQIKVQALEQGKTQGLQQGHQEGRAQVKGLLEQLQAMMVEGQQILEAMFIQQEPEIRQLVCHIVGQVVQTQIETDDEVVVRVTRECLRKAADRQHVRLLIHPDDQKKIEEWVPNFTRMYDDIDKITVEADPRVNRGGVMVESGAGGVDGRLDKQIEILNDIVLNS